MIKKSKNKNHPNDKITTIGGAGEIPRRILEVREDRSLPADMICRYCGKGGTIWDLGDGLYKCGHCLRTYSKF